ncbi:hypothetical protein COU15_02210 [Candidatus Kaiserbacteria bacterium CG10_big_fil_rev_8_21_14_0_10_45_20]|uniref:Uncharacterized protein n=1 Tax=Candidatus Kaiserbacteria bacterium CG10_big_fil_rev_8_21_14_0_10_45_20 TaxID=1974607 RepID=A0A2H0UFK8_9BACT|nr:MAG: hypothetical protein COU15_02210 [Candidatus Kaiserbacteria bacterium CG10_big_fil_rev_8_21_14_0_10_45_20]
MNKLFQQYKNVIIVFVVVIGLFVAYSIFFGEEDTDTLSVTNVATEQTVVEQELLSLLLELRSITLDTSLFDDPRFKSLKDFSQELTSEPVGRPNPFSPLGE